MRKRIANLTSNILNPFLVSLITIWLLSFVSAANTLDALKWALISITFSVLPVFLVVVYLVRKGRLDGIFIHLRGQRTRVYLLAIFSVLMCLISLAYLRAPAILLAAFAAGLLALVVFMCINLWWKISLHTAFVAAAATVLVLLYGWIATVTVALVPLIAWARMELEHHSLAQVTTGAVLAALITLVVIYPFVTA